MQQALNTLKNLGDLVENVSLYYTDEELRKMVLIDPGKNFLLPLAQLSIGKIFSSKTLST
jgi:hypothetical protein